MFLGWLATTIAAVEVLVLTGNLGLLVVAWVATSASLHRLLVFYPDCRRAVVAARKKFVAARVGDGFLVTAPTLLYDRFGTGDLGAIYEAQIQRTAPVWRRRIPLLLADYIERQRIQRSFGAFSRQYGNVVPTHLTGNDWRAVPVFRRGDEGSAYHEVPRRVGSAVMRLIDARFEPGRTEDGAAPWLPT